jgi:hypothetical protein
MITGPAVSETKNDCASEDQQKFTPLTDRLHAPIELTPVKISYIHWQETGTSAGLDAVAKRVSVPAEVCTTVIQI